MRKIVSLILAVLLVAGLLCTSAFAAGTSIYGTTANDVKPGDTVTIYFNVSGNPGFGSSNLTIEVSAPLSIVGISGGMLTSTNVYTESLAYAGEAVNSNELIKGDGTLCSVQIAVAADAAPGSYPVKLTDYYLSYMDGNKQVDIPCAGSSGLIVISEPETQPTDPQPTESEPTEPKPTESEPTEPKPTESEPTEPKPTESEPTEPKPTESEPTEPKPTESEPTEPKPTESKPTEPKPTESEPSEEPTTKPTTKPTEPKPTKPGKDEQPKNGDVTPYPVFFLLAVMAVAATAFVLKRKFDV